MSSEKRVMHVNGKMDLQGSIGGHWEQEPVTVLLDKKNFCIRTSPKWQALAVINQWGSPSRQMRAADNHESTHFAIHRNFARLGTTSRAEVATTFDQSMTRTQSDCAGSSEG